MKTTQTRKPKYIELRYVKEGVAVKAELQWDLMPRTCAEVVKHLPITGKATHARYSGSEVATLITKKCKIAREHATCACLPGDVAYVWLDRDDHYGLDDDVSEICWFYDRDARPSMFEGPVRVNVFARIAGDMKAFAKACADTRLSGVKTIRISVAE
jgi:hypothetical protein